MNLSTNISYAADNPGGTAGTTTWEADYANLNLTVATRLGGKLVSTVQTDDTTAWANIKTKFTFAPTIEQVDILGVETFGTASNVTMLYLQSSLNSTTWTTVGSTTTKSGTVSFSGLTIPAASYLRFGIALTASGTNSGLLFTGIRVFTTAAEVVNVTGVTLNKSTSSLWVGDTEQLTATVAPANATDKSVTWSTLNSAVATVNSSGLVTAVAAGSATIRVTTTDGSFTADCVYTVSAVLVTSVTLNETSLELITGHVNQLLATIAPANATNKNVTWSSSDETKVTVSSTGLVTAVATTSSAVTITVTTADGGFTDTVSVTVVTDPFVKINTSTFNETGSTNWPTATGMAAYFSTGYGVNNAGTGATIKAPMLLKDVVVGSQFRVEIASVTNNASNTTNVSVYGLDYDGGRITGITGTYTNPTNGGANTLTTLTDRALANKGYITLNVSTITKIYGLEVVFETSSSRSLLAQIEVFAKAATDSVQAESFANLVNTDVGAGATGSCATILTTLQNDYSLLSTGAKSIVDGSSDSAFANARERVSYLQAWVAANPGARQILTTATKTNLVAVIVIGAIALTSLLGYYILNKKKRFY